MLKERRSMDATKPYFVNPPDIDHKEFALRKEEREKKNIPVPFVETLEHDNNQLLDDKFDRRSTYVRFREEQETCEYDLDAEDEKWLEQRNYFGRKEAVARSLLEAAFDKFERAQTFNQHKIIEASVVSPEDAKGNADVVPTQEELNLLFRWWLATRQAKVKRAYPLGKPLLEAFHTSPDPTDVYMPFHRRDPEKPTVSTWLRQKQTKELVNEIRLQIEALTKVKNILARVKRREVMKKEYFRCQFEIWNRTPKQCQKVDTSQMTLAQTVSVVYGTSDPIDRLLASIEDSTQFERFCKKVNFVLPAYLLKPLPSPSAIPSTLKSKSSCIDPTPEIGTMALQGGHGCVWYAQTAGLYDDGESGKTDKMKLEDGEVPSSPAPLDWHEGMKRDRDENVKAEPSATPTVGPTTVELTLPPPKARKLH
eukprot:TRINITY_DN12221_c0_g1_i1.p1 TRINITY_DN12221_c0_g1~~TRINITY_DN12221_c0_g1_i1.p1  ORF type:complete len:423 (+),score=38.61 TRINITY_DN12221_c0_g1_i1:38-1306(+)